MQKGGYEILFESEKHKELYERQRDQALLPLRGSSNSFQAAIFLLTSSSNLWSLFEGHIDGEHIYFSEINRRTLSLKDYITMQFARDLLSDHVRMTFHDLTDRNIVSEKMFRLYTKVIFIKRYGIEEVSIREL
ncbi:hypothetical protein MKC66_17810 [[Clostridium] innocuum]|nr:hypothetical protein [[Clostridium] innocuum]